MVAVAAEVDDLGIVDFVESVLDLELAEASKRSVSSLSIFIRLPLATLATS
jgi:hypothetical protein